MSTGWAHLARNCAILDIFVVHIWFNFDFPNEYLYNDICKCRETKIVICCLKPDLYHFHDLLVI